MLHLATTRRGLGLVASLSAAALLMTACGGDEGPTANAEGLTEITVGVMPNADVAALYVGIDQGFFEDHGLEITPQVASSGAAIVPSVASGQYDFGFGGVVSTLIATTQGIPLVAVSAADQEATTPEEAFLAMAVKKGSPIAGWSDLKGKTIGVNVVGGINEVQIRGALAAAGMDELYDTFKFLEVPGTDMASALANDRVDAILAAEPFLTQQAANITRIAYPAQEAFPGGTVGTFYTTPSYKSENPEVVDDFVAAMKESLEFSAENPDVVREVIVDYSEMDPTLASQMNLPGFSTDLNVDSITAQAEIMETHGMVDKDVDVDAYLGR